MRSGTSGRSAPWSTPTSSSSSSRMRASLCARRLLKNELSPSPMIASASAASTGLSQPGSVWTMSWTVRVRTDSFFLWIGSVPPAGPPPGVAAGFTGPLPPAAPPPALPTADALPPAPPLPPCWAEKPDPPLDDPLPEPLFDGDDPLVVGEEPLLLAVCPLLPEVPLPLPFPLPEGGLPPLGLPPPAGGFFTICCAWPTVWLTVSPTVFTTCWIGLSCGRTGFAGIVGVGTLTVGALTVGTVTAGASGTALPTPSERAKVGTAAAPNSAHTAPIASRRRIPMSFSSATSYPA